MKSNKKEIREREMRKVLHDSKYTSVSVSSSLLTNMLTIWMLKLTFNTLNTTTRCADMGKAAFDAAAKTKVKSKSDVIKSWCAFQRK